MTDTASTTGTLDVPGARLYHERRGSGPLLLVIGSPMDSTGFTGLADALAGTHTVVTYDPRGLGNSSREDTDADITPEQQADDLSRLLDALGGGPVDVFGSSGGAVVGLALATGHPGRVRTLIAHEPPLVELLPDSARVRAEVDDIYETYRAEGVEKAMRMFLEHTGLAGAGAPPPDDASPAEAPQWQPSPEEMARMRASTEMLFAHLIRPTTRYRPDLAALRGSGTTVVLAGGATSAGQLANRTARALAEQLGTELVEFPGDHGGFIGAPVEFARQVDRVLAGS